MVWTDRADIQFQHFLHVEREVCEQRGEAPTVTESGHHDRPQRWRCEHMSPWHRRSLPNKTGVNGKMITIKTFNLTQDYLSS